MPQTIKAWEGCALLLSSLILILLFFFPKGRKELFEKASGLIQKILGPRGRDFLIICIELGKLFKLGRVSFTHILTKEANEVNFAFFKACCEGAHRHYILKIIEH